MSDYRPSIIEYYSKKKKSSCGYCSTSDGSLTYDLHAHILRVQDYQDMIDRGWRRCGMYCYKAIMETSCCPLYTIKCAAKEFKLSKTQKKIIKRFNNFLVNGTISKEKTYKNTDIAQPMEIYHTENDNMKGDVIDLDMPVTTVDPSLSHVKVNSQSTQSNEEKKMKPVEPVKTNESSMQAKKNKCMKAKYLRIERKRQKLQKLGLSEEEIAKKLVEKKKYPVVKSIEDFLNEPMSKSKVHNLRISLVKSSPRSEEFDNSFAESFDLYKRYQKFIHKDPPEKLTQFQFERFLVISPLQIQLVLVKSSEFKNSFRESAALFVKYQKAVHHESDENCDVLTFHNFLVDSPLEASEGYGSYHQQYWLDDKLIAVGVIDILPKCISSVYFFYDPEYAHLSLGTYGALREVEFTRKLSTRFPDLTYYYMGFYIHSCVKMKYKGAFSPSYLLCPEVYTWHPIKECLPKLNLSKYCRFNEDPDATDANSNVTPSDVLILYNKTAMPLSYYLKKKKCDKEELEEIMEYAKVIGKTCAKSMLLFRK